MSHSLRCRLKGLCHKKILTDREVARLCKALDMADAIEDIKAEIDSHCSDNRDRNDGLYIAMKIIDKHISGKEELDD